MTPISALASIPPADPIARPAAPAEAPEEERGLWDRMWGKEGFSFGALLDVVNPLHHIPVVSTIYRAITGDTIGPAPRMMGGAIFGGVIGLIASAADSAVEAVTGRDTGSHVLAMLPEPDPASQWAAHDEKRGQRPQMAGLMNMPDSNTMLASVGDIDRSERRGHRPQMAGLANMPTTDTMRASAADTGKSEMASASSGRGPSAPATPSDAADGAVPSANAALEAAQKSPVATNHPLNVPARSAQMGAGGRQVPLAATGRAGMVPANLPSAQTLAADPALLREMRQGGAVAAQKATGRIDTAIKGHGMIAPSAEARAKTNDGAPLGASTRLDHAARDPRSPTFDANAGDHGDSGTGRPGARRDGPAIPEVGPDFLMKMQQALDKYQAGRATPAPSIDLSH